MQSKNRNLSIIALAIALFAFSTISFGQETKTETTKTDKATKAVRGEKRDGAKRQFGRAGFAGHRGMMARRIMARGRMHGFAMRGINLTDAQKEQIKGLRDSNKPDQAFRDEVRSLIKAKKDGTITADQMTRLKAIHEDGIAKRKAAHEQMQNILTAEQKATIESRKAEMKTRMQERKLKFEGIRKVKPVDPVKPIK